MKEKYKKLLISPSLVRRSRKINLPQRILLRCDEGTVLCSFVAREHLKDLEGFKLDLHRTVLNRAKNFASEYTISGECTILERSNYRGSESDALTHLR